MSIDGISLLFNPTSAVWTGGTATVLETDGTPVATGIHVSDQSETNFKLRTHITFKNRNPSMNPDGSWNKGKRDVIITMPITLADGSVSYQVVRKTVEIHPDISAAQLSNLRHLDAQCALDVELDKFYTGGSTK